MSRTYTVKSGDTLLGIAIKNDVDFNQILTLNPKYQSNPDLIHPGEIIKFPEEFKLEDLQSICPIEPPAPKRPLASEGCLEKKSQCKGTDVKNFLFQTDDKGKFFYCLDEESQKYLDEEICQTEKLIEAYHELSKQAPKAENATEQKLLEHQNKKKQWAIDAVNAGAIAPEKVAEKDETSKEDSSTNQKKLEERIKVLERRLIFTAIYTPPILVAESSVSVVQKQAIKRLNDELENCKALLEQFENSKQTSSGSNPSGIGKVKLENFANSKTLTTQPAQRHIIEVFSASHNRLVYIRAVFLEREKVHWKKRSVTQKMLSSLKVGNTAEFKQAILKDIKESITKDIENPSVELVIKQWNADGGQAEEWKASQYILTDNGETRFAASAEAQLLRWGMGAKINSTVKPLDGQIDIGISAQAKVALAEASVKFESFLPYEAGFPISLTYTDINKKEQQYSFGRFRTKGCLTMSCFAGAVGSATAEASNQVEEQKAGHTVLLSPSISMDQSKGRIGVKAEGFAGAQVGGELTGGFEWLHPDKEPNSSGFASLAELKAEGNVSLGVGASGDFHLALERGRLFFYCNGQIVWGPGGGGGFGAAVNFEQIWELVLVVLDGLQRVDYRQLKNINEEMYDYIVNSSYMAFATNAMEIISSPTMALMKAIKAGTLVLDDWYQFRQSRKNEAEILAGRILKAEAWSGMEPNKLLPETIGMMLDVLTECFVDSFEEPQEQAITYLLSNTISSWRKFEEVLVRINPTGSKQENESATLDNLARINAILDGKQQTQFNQWVFNLIQKEYADGSRIDTAFVKSTTEQMRKKRELVSEQYANLS